VEIITYHTDPRSIIILVLGYDVVEEEWGRLAYIDGFDGSASLDGSHLYHIHSHILSLVCTQQRLFIIIKTIINAIISSLIYASH
jgi:hypothetical protein